MKLFEGKEARLIVGDIETLASLFDAGFYNPDTMEWVEFQISQYQNDLYKFVKWYNRKDWDYVCGYNYLDFDAQVIQFILNEYEKWGELSSLEMVGKIYAFTQKLIDDKNYGIFSPYREFEFEIPVIDVYRIFGLDNEARRSSLKKCEFQIDYPSVEEMPIHHSIKSLSKEEIGQVQSYRRTDVLATYELLKICLGDTTHPIYKENNQLELRANIEKEFGINCLNYSDIKIGEDIVKNAYVKAKKISIRDLPKRGTFRKEIRLKNCIPSYVEFSTLQLKNLLNITKNEVIKQTDTFEKEFVFYNTKYKLALGGLHSENENEVYEEDEMFEYHDYDAPSFYPAILVNNGYFPKHLGKELLNTYSVIYDKRIYLKPQAKTDKRIKGIVEGLKLSLNAVFGKLGLMESWLYDKQCLLSVTLTGQFTLLMLIEMYELAGFHVISANTDGITVRVSKDKVHEIAEINEKWHEKTGFTLERVKYKKIIYSTVNDYIAIKDDGEVKKKGDFITDFELWKNKSMRIVPLALEEYFVSGTHPKYFIENHSPIYDFCIMARASGQLHLELQEAEKVTKLKKLVRYYLSDTGIDLYKRGIGSTGKPLNKIENAPNELGHQYIQYFNQFEEREDYKIAKHHYILKALKFIDKVSGTKKAKNYIESFIPKQQLTLF